MGNFLLAKGSSVLKVKATHLKKFSFAKKCETIDLQVNFFRKFDGNVRNVLVRLSILKTCIFDQSLSLIDGERS